MTNFPPPSEYDRAVDAHLAPTAPTTPVESPAPSPSSRRRWVAVVAALALLLGPAVVGYQIGQNHDSSTASPALSQPIANAPSNGSQSNGSSNGTPSSINAQAITDQVDDSVVNINTTLDNGAAAGTGIIISPQGLVLTNNHVIADSESIRVELVATGKTNPATVLGYNIVDDVAVIQLDGASGLKAASLGDSSSLTVGDAIVALGNAGGRGGEPTTVSGAVTGLNQQITASEANGANAQTLTDLIQVNANIQAGDSGGPLVDSTGAVVGMNAAASSRNGGFGGGFPTAGSQNEGYAIPIEKALAIAKKIVSKDGGTNIHVGANRAVIGVGIVPDSSTTVNRGGPFGGLGNGQSGSGALVATQDGVQSGSAADKAGITNGSTITAINGTSVTSASALTRLMVQYHPGDKIDIAWTDANGNSHHATITLGSGPPA
jgi:S1-C subfamily serine protease